MSPISGILRFSISGRIEKACARYFRHSTAFFADSSLIISSSEIYQQSQLPETGAEESPGSKNEFNGELANKSGATTISSPDISIRYAIPAGMAPMAVKPGDIRG
jgi:hypothetical protein